MPNFFTDNADLQYYVDKGIDWDQLVELTEFMFKSPDGFKDVADAVDFYRETLRLVGEFVATEVAPHSAQIDREGVQFKDGEAIFPERLQSVFEAINGLELHGMCIPRELGGMNAPLLAFFLAGEILARADISVMAHFGFHGAIGMAMVAYSVLEGTTEVDPKSGEIRKTRFEEAIKEIVSGEAWGAMDITEPNAGSDVGQVRTVGEQDEQGNWFVTGTKIFITSGHGKYHFVLARTEESDPNDPFAGLGGLSMFLVKTYEEVDGKRKRIVTVDRLEEKLGHHGSATASLTFDKAPAQLIGERGDGFKLMLTLMNNARIGVGFECLGICESAYRIATEYALERKTMGKPIAKHEIIADYLDEMRVDTQGIRAMAVQAGLYEELSRKISVLLEAKVINDEEEIKKYQAQQKRYTWKARRLTPLLKYLGAEKSVEMAHRAVQILGGVGYTTEFGAEKLLRDATVMPIYEGTSQIQSLMVMKDTLMAAMKNPGGFATKIAQCRWRAASARDLLERRVAKLQVLSLKTQQFLLTKTAADKYRSLRGKPIAEWPERFLKNWDPKTDFAYAMLHAERLTRQLADEAICEILLDQAKKHDERRPILEAYLERAEPRAKYLHEQITTTGRRLLADLDEAAEEREAV